MQTMPKPVLIPGLLAVATFSLWLGFLPVRADANPVTVTITQQSPLVTLSASGGMVGVTEATVGTHYTLVSCDGRQVVLQDAQGTRFQIAVTSTDYTPPPATTAAATPPPSAPPAASLPPPTPVAPPPSAPPPSLSAVAPDASQTSSPPISDDAVATINKGIGKPFFTTQNFWQESGLLIANRLGLRLEDKTKWETAYRRYFYDKEQPTYNPAPILGGAAYCVALYADADDKPTSVLIAFTNDGDYKAVGKLRGDLYELQHGSGPAPADADKKISDLEAQIDADRQSFEPDRQAEAETLTQNLTTLFGEPKRTNFGSSADTREDVLRWDWNGVSFLLSCEENKYNLLHILPTDIADNHGRVGRIPLDEMVTKLTDSVEHRPNGDVVITQIPMADQGLKGYCVPATWERVLRYTGVPGDMYTLSRIGGTGFGGGTSSGNIASQLDDTLHEYGRRAETLDFEKIDAISLHRYIDKGIPVFWSLNPDGYETVEQRYALADREKEWDTWKKLLDQSRSSSSPKPDALQDLGGHQVIITGYNPDTKEIAWSDPWGRNTQERWMTEEEAQRCSLGDFYIITW